MMMARRLRLIWMQRTGKSAMRHSRKCLTAGSLVKSSQVIIVSKSTPHARASGWVRWGSEVPQQDCRLVYGVRFVE